MKNKNNNPDDNFIPNEDDELNFRSEDFFYKDFDEEQTSTTYLIKVFYPVCNATDPSCSFCQGEGEISSDDSFTDFIGRFGINSRI